MPFADQRGSVTAFFNKDGKSGVLRRQPSGSLFSGSTRPTGSLYWYRPVINAPVRVAEHTAEFAYA